MTMNSYMRAIPTRFQPFDTDQYRVYTGVWFDSASIAHIFCSDMPSIEETISGKSTLIMHIPNQSREEWSKKIHFLQEKTGRELSFQGDPLSVAYASDVDSVFKLLVDAVPQQDTRLIILCRFRISDPTQFGENQAAHLVKEHAQQRDITILEPINF